MKLAGIIFLNQLLLVNRQISTSVVQWTIRNDFSTSFFFFSTHLVWLFHIWLYVFSFLPTHTKLYFLRIWTAMMMDECSAFFFSSCSLYMYYDCYFLERKDIIRCFDNSLLKQTQGEKISIDQLLFYTTYICLEIFNLHKILFSFQLMTIEMLSLLLFNMPY